MPRRIALGIVRTCGALLLAAAPTRTVAQTRVAEDVDARERYFLLPRTYPFGTMRPDAWRRAVADVQARRTSLANLTMAAPLTWQPMGPAPITNPWGGANAGRINDLAVHPTNSAIIYVAANAGGVWRTTNGGAHWVPLTDFQCALGSGAVAIDPVNPSIVYAGTGDPHGYRAYQGCGFLRSTDGGQNWTTLATSTLTAYTVVRSLVIDPRTAGNPATTRLVASTTNGVYLSTDGGTTWTQTLNRFSGYRIIANPVNPATLYVGGSVSGAGLDAAIFRSLDAGATWTRLPGGPPPNTSNRIEIAISKSNPSTVYAAACAAGASVPNSGSLYALYRSTDGGNSWQTRPAAGFPAQGQCGYDLVIWANDADPNNVTLGMVGLYRSLDGGGTFTGVVSYNHVDHHVIVGDSRNAGTIYLGNDGGIAKSTDGGATYVNIVGDLAITQFYPGASLHPTSVASAIGGTQDNGCLEFRGGTTWSPFGCGDGGYTAIDPGNPNTQYFENQWISSSGYSGPQRRDGGTGSYGSLKVTGIDLTESAAFIPPLVMSPHDPKTLYFGATRLYRTQNRGDLWQPWFTPPGTQQYEVVFSIAPSPLDPATVWIATYYHVYVTSNGGATWRDVTLGLPTRFFTWVSADPVFPQRAYIAVGGTGTPHVYQTDDRGLTWRSISTNLPDINTNVVRAIAQTGDLLAGTDFGLFRRPAGSTQWLLETALPNAPYMDLPYNPQTGQLLAVSYGRGMFSTQIPVAGAVLSVSGVARRTVRLVGDTTKSADSVAVSLFGQAGPGTPWTASAKSAWVKFTTSSGTGNGRVRWSRDPAGLAAGTHVDTIVVSAGAAIGSPASTIDSLVVTQGVVGGFAPDSATGSLSADAKLQLTLAFPASVGLLNSWSGTVSWDSTVVRIDSVKAPAPYWTVQSTSVNAGSIQVTGRTTNNVSFTAGTIPVTDLHFRPANVAADGRTSVRLSVDSVGNTSGASYRDLVVPGRSAAVRYFAPVLRGDISRDQRVSVLDAQLSLESLVNRPIPSPWRLFPDGDANCDGVVNTLDAQLILMRALSLPTPGVCVGTYK